MVLIANKIAYQLYKFEIPKQKDAHSPPFMDILLLYENRQM